MGKLAELQLGGGRLRPVSFKKTKHDGSVVEVHSTLRVLTKHELDIARVNARQTVARLDKTLVDGRAFEELLEDARIVEILAIALRNPDSPDQPWATPMEIELMLTPPEIATLWKFYEDHQDACGPIIHDMTVDAYEATLEAIAKEGSADPFLYFASPLRNAFITTMVRQLLQLRMESSSHSSVSTENSESELSKPNDEAAADLESVRDELAMLTARVHVLELDAERHASP